MVVATEISGPAQVYNTSSLSEAIELPTTLTMDRTRAPRFFASRKAARVSAVSPDWLMISTSVLESTIGSRYRNSDARSTSTGIRVSFSSTYLPTTPA